MLNVSPLPTCPAAITTPINVENRHTTIIRLGFVPSSHHDNNTTITGPHETMMIASPLSIFFSAVKYRSVAMKYPKAPSKNSLVKIIGFGQVASRENSFLTASISTVATTKRASRVPTTLAPLSYAKLAKVGESPNPILLTNISATPSRFGFLRTRYIH